MCLSVVSLNSSSVGYIWPIKLSKVWLLMVITSSIYLYMKINWEVYCFLPAENKDCINSALLECRHKSARREAQFVPSRMQTACLKTFPAKKTNMFSTKNRASYNFIIIHKLPVPISHEKTLSFGQRFLSKFSRIAKFYAILPNLLCRRTNRPLHLDQMTLIRHRYFILDINCSIICDLHSCLCDKIAYSQ